MNGFARTARSEAGQGRLRILRGILRGISRRARRWWYRNVYLRSPHWKKLRRRALMYAGHKCITCGSKVRLEVHHLRYVDERGKSILWHERMSDLAVLCHKHHRGFHPTEVGGYA